MEERNDRRDLYEEFESEVVRRGNTEAFFDESDLIEIFDYASDLDNYIVKMEVLLYGAVHYPKSEALATRRAWMYYSFGDSEVTEELNERVAHKGILNRLLSMRARMDKVEHPEDEIPELNEIIDSTDDFDDEEIIQFTEYVMDIGLDDWLLKNKERIQQKCSYPQTFLYGMADRFDENENFENSVKLFEELTMLEPFTVDFWLRLGTAHLNLSQYEAALTSAEYALAIDPDSTMALRIKGVSLYHLQRDPEGVSQAYRKVIASGEAQESDIATLAASLVESGHNAEAIKILKEYIATNPTSKMAIDVLLMIDVDQAKPYLEYLFAYSCPTEENIIEWTRGHVTHGQFAAAAVVLDLFNTLHSLSLSNQPFMFEVFYFAQRFKEVVKHYEKNFKNEPTWHFQPSPTIPYIMSLARTGNRKRAIKECEAILDIVQSTDDCSTIIEMMKLLQCTPSMTRALAAGYCGVLRTMIEAMKEKMDPDAFDPMLH